MYLGEEDVSPPPSPSTPTSRRSSPFPSHCKERSISAAGERVKSTAARPVQRRFLSASLTAEPSDDPLEILGYAARTSQKTCKTNSNRYRGRRAMKRSSTSLSLNEARYRAAQSRNLHPSHKASVRALNLSIATSLSKDGFATCSEWHNCDDFLELTNKDDCRYQCHDFELEIQFSEIGPLGLNVKEHKDGLLRISEIDHDIYKKRRPSNVVQVGDVLEAVEGVAVKGLSFEEVVDLINRERALSLKHRAGVMTLKFWRILPFKSTVKRQREKTPRKTNGELSATHPTINALGSIIENIQLGPREPPSTITPSETSLDLGCAKSWLGFGSLSSSKSLLVDKVDSVPLSTLPQGPTLPSSRLHTQFQM